MAQGSGLTRGDRNRNRKVEALRRVVVRDRAVLAVDLGEDKQVAVVMDHEGRVLARKVVNDLPRTFRTADLWLIHAADCCSRYSSWTCCGVRY